MIGVWHVAWKVAVATGLHCRKDIPKTSYRLARSHLHSMPLCRHGSPQESEAAYLSKPSPELHRGLVHGQTVVDLVWIKREDWAHGWPHRDLNDEGEELDETLRHVGEHLRLAVAAGHLQK